jgi:glycosyltransferase involved in cell wall biosynthesis
MKILIALTYFRPHVSGLTIYVQRLANALVERGHEVTILTSQYDRALPRDDEIEGVHIRRVPVAFRLSKGVIMPGIGMEATRQVKQHDVLSLHLPQLDAAGIAIRGKLLRRATVLTYHCDLRLPGGLVNRAANIAANFTNHLAARFSDAIVAYTQDFAINSPLLSNYLDKIRVITPPVIVTPNKTQADIEFRTKYIGENEPVIGIAARLATEKGVEYLLEALPIILERYPKAQVLFAGQYQNVMGEADYAQRLQPLLERVSDHWTFLGVLNAEEMTTFYRCCDVTVLPSINSTESFGLVQIESMICSTPVVASNLPGVRQPVRITGMGKVVPLHDGPAIARAIIEILDHPENFIGDTQAIAERFSPSRTAEGYEVLFNEIQEKMGLG